MISRPGGDHVVTDECRYAQRGRIRHRVPRRWARYLISSPCRAAPRNSVFLDDRAKVIADCASLIDERVDMIADRAPVITGVESLIVQIISSIDEQKSIIDEHAQLDRRPLELGR